MHAYIVLAVLGLALGHPMQGLDRRQDDFALQNGRDAIAANKRFSTLTTDSPCQEGENACVNDEFAQCLDGRYVLFSCGPEAICSALPLTDGRGTSNTCTTAEERDARIAATGATDSEDAVQSSLTLDPAVIATNFTNDGQSDPLPGQVPSLTSSNNFINFCKTVNKPITNGGQIAEGSCNPAPMGVIAARNKMPTCKFEFPPNGATIPANQTFTIRLVIQNLDTGYFVNAQRSFFAAPQEVNNEGFIQGHSHVVIEKLESLDQTKPLDPLDFKFFKGLNEKAQDGVLSAEVTDGLAPGFYKLSSINTATNHQPVLVAVAQHGSLDDAVYFTVV